MKFVTFDLIKSHKVLHFKIYKNYIYIYRISSNDFILNSEHYL